MSHIYLIRHGQASFGAENYDQLSELGQRQAKVIGDYFASQGAIIADVVHGDMSRQQQTAKILAKQAGYTDELVCLPDANEFDSENLIKHYLPILAAQSSRLNEIIKSGDRWWKKPDDFESFFCALVALWQADSNCPFESWNTFQARCMQCLNDVAALQKQACDSGIKNEHQKKKGVTILATSGGLISVIMQSILNFDNRSFMDMNLTTNNASISEIIWNGTEKTEKQNPIRKRNRLLSFNNITPLVLAKDRQLITRK